MKNEIYLVLCCPKKEFKEGAKEGRKCKMMVYRCYCSPIWATASKEEAIADCRIRNTIKLSNHMYFMLPIQFFK